MSLKVGRRVNVDIAVHVLALTSGIGQGKIPGELNPGLIIFFAICFVAVVYFSIQHYRKNGRK
jgi:hypothetical protein